MKKHTKESYELEIPEEGLDYDILDIAFNPSTEQFITANGIIPGMRILDVGSGSGLMTHYLARKTGINGRVLSIDNSLQQLARAEQYCKEKDDKNVEFKQLSVYDLPTLNEHFDLIYCRFVLHHIQSPRLTIGLFYEALNKGGIYIAEEGIISSAFSYPPSQAWQGNRTQMLLPNQEQDGLSRDGEFGMKLYYWMKKTGFTIKDIKLVQPILTTYEQKRRLLDGHDAYKKTAISHGQSEADWEAKRQELIRLARDDCSIIGFHQSCQVCGVK